MEHLHFTFECGTAVKAAHSHAIIGVVGSGDLEVLLELSAKSQACNVEISTSVEGYRDIWKAVLASLMDRYPFGGMNIFINDAGATPAVASLRLEQAINALTESAK